MPANQFSVDMSHVGKGVSITPANPEGHQVVAPDLVTYFLRHGSAIVETIVINAGDKGLLTFHIMTRVAHQKDQAAA